MPLLRQAIPAALAACALVAVPARAESLRLHPRTLLPHTPAGGTPNAPATDPAGRLRRVQPRAAALAGEHHRHGARAPHPTAIHRQDHQKVMNGSAPSMTAGGHFVFFAAANMVDSNVYEKFASCPLGGVTQVSGSPHGNYAVYACSNGQAFMSYVGGR